MLCLSSSPGARAAASIDIGEMIDFLGKDKATLQKKIYNRDDDTAFVQVEVVEVFIDKGKEFEPPAGDNPELRENTLIASPARLIIPSNSFQMSRIVFSGVRDRERYFRVRYVPVIPNEQNSFGLSPEQIKKNNDDMLSAGMSVSIGYGTLVIVSPASPYYDTRIEEAGSEFRIVNNGNATATLRYTNTCVKKKDDCRGFGEGVNVFPGQTRSFERKQERSYSFMLVEGGPAGEITKKHIRIP
ncbi:hypothetical protein NM74_04845 [Aeromonas hydrophila]|nr:hypothetical protein NM74_04845 [Aeromonas hydrophila]